VTWGLLVTWAALMSLGVISIASPQWLQRWSQRGIEAEARAYKEYGDTKLRERDFRLAIPQYLRSLEIKPNQPGVMVNLAVAYINAGTPPGTPSGDAQAAAYRQKGAKLLNEALQMETSRNLRGVIYFNLGELYEREGQTDQAIRHYRMALGPDIEGDKVHRKLGSLYLAKGELERARTAFEKTLECQLDPGLSYEDMLHRSVDKFQGNEEILKVIAEQLAQDFGPEDLERYDLEVIRQTQQHDPEIAKTHNHLGVICAQQGYTVAAVEHFERSLEIWPGNIDATRNLKLLRQMQEAGQP
jgi:tetratricopeptide (TPR) repeat protein